MEEINIVQARLTELQEKSDPGTNDKNEIDSLKLKLADLKGKKELILAVVQWAPGRFTMQEGRWVAHGNFAGACKKYSPTPVAPQLHYPSLSQKLSFPKSLNVAFGK